MPRIKLRKLFSEKNEVAAALAGVLGAMDPRPAVQDANGSWLYGEPGAQSDKAAIEHEGETIGWVWGKEAPRIASLIAAIAQKEAEKIALADELLDKYREINLLYNLTEKLAATLDLRALADISLTESCRLVHAGAGQILLRDEQDGMQSIISLGAGSLQAALERGNRIAAKAVDTGKGEIVNAQGESSASFLSAPLKSKDRVIGVILLAKPSAQTFRAEDIKLLGTVASEAAPAIENAMMYDRALREARVREERLRKQIETLQIQIDDSRTARQVAEITETEYFQALRRKAERLRYGAHE